MIRIHRKGCCIRIGQVRPWDKPDIIWPVYICRDYIGFVIHRPEHAGGFFETWNFTKGTVRDRICNSAEHKHLVFYNTLWDVISIYD